MSSNQEKIVFMSITHTKPLALHNQFVYGTPFSVNEYKYLGATITSELWWEIHFNNIIKKATGKLCSLRRSLKMGTPETKLLAFKISIRPS